MPWKARLTRSREAGASGAAGRWPGPTTPYPGVVSDNEGYVEMRRGFFHDGFHIVNFC
jgi:hypothetical protein